MRIIPRRLSVLAGEELQWVVWALIRDGCCHTSIERITRLRGNWTEELGGNVPFTAR